MTTKKLLQVISFAFFICSCALLAFVDWRIAAAAIGLYISIRLDMVTSD